MAYFVAFVMLVCFAIVPPLLCLIVAKSDQLGNLTPLPFLFVLVFGCALLGALIDLAGRGILFRVTQQAEATLKQE